MATLYGTEYSNAYVAVPSVKIQPGDASGGVKFLYFDYPISTSLPSANDIIKVGKIPKNVRVLDAYLYFSDLGTVGTLELGWAASAELDSAGSAVEAAQAQGFLSSIDVHTAADVIKATDDDANAAGVLKNFDAEVDLQIKVTTAWDATSGTLRGCLIYINV